MRDKGWKTIGKKVVKVGKINKYMENWT